MVGKAIVIGKKSWKIHKNGTKKRIVGAINGVKWWEIMEAGWRAMQMGNDDKKIPCHFLLKI